MAIPFNCLRTLKPAFLDLQMKLYSVDRYLAFTKDSGDNLRTLLEFLQQLQTATHSLPGPCFTTGWVLGCAALAS